MAYEKFKIMKLQSESDDRLFTGDKKKIIRNRKQVVKTEGCRFIKSCLY
jgi:hypothetical protein